MARTLEQWVGEVPRGLERMQVIAERRLRALGQRSLEEVRRRAKGSIRDSIELEDRPGEVVLSSDHPGAGINEYGGTIHGRPWLAIPLSAATRGLPGPRSDPANLFVLRSKDGRLFLASRRAGGLELHWKLQHEVTIPARPFMAPGIEAARKGFEQDVLDSVTEALLHG